MDSDSSGFIYGLVDASGDYLSGPCAKGCLLERVDVVSRTVVTQNIVRLGMADVVAFQHDPIGNSAVVGYVISKGNSSYYFPSDPYPGFQVTIIPF